MQSGAAWSDSALYEVINELLKLSTGEGLHQVCWHTVYRHDVWQVDLSRGSVRKLDFCFLSCLFESLHSHSVFAKVCATVLALELLYEPVDNAVIEVITTQVSITIGSFHLKYAVAQFEHRYVVCTTTAVEYYDLHVFVALVKTVCQSSSCWLVHDTANIQTCDLACLFGSLTLAVIEVCRYSDHCLCYLLTKIIFSGLLHLLEDDS